MRRDDGLDQSCCQGNCAKRGRRQNPHRIKGGVFPIRLKAEDWQSGEINWLLDVIAPTRDATASVIANFKQVVKGGDLRLHPIVAKLVDAETLEKMGAEKLVRGEAI